MSAFDKIIGYESVKKELERICDMFQNKEIYQSLGAKLPRGLLLYGAPGLGKTLMANCLMQESGLCTYTIRRNKNSGDFVDEITRTFDKAIENVPCIIFLDDMDKFANEDECRCDAEEYVAVQAGIDKAKGSEVFVVGTVNKIRKLPESLTRSGRFDIKIEVNRPSFEDSGKIIKYYLNEKKLSENINYEDVTGMLAFSTCAELESVMNEAAIDAAHARRNEITMPDIISAVLHNDYNHPDNLNQKSKEELYKIALHEAGHLVVSEILCPGSVGLASIRSQDSSGRGGLVRRCKELKNMPYYDTLVSLAGKAAVELYFSDSRAQGCQSDIQRAFENLRYEISDNCACGFGLINVETPYTPSMSQSLNSRTETVVQTELERCFFKVRDILLKNKDFLEKVALELTNKKVLVISDIKALKEDCVITSVEF